jgi:hypothetical protein
MNDNKQTYPTGLTLPDGKVLTVQDSPELRQFFETTLAVNSRNEKDKLYSNIKQHSDKAEAAEKEVAKLTTQLQEIMTSYAQSAEDRTRLTNELAVRTQEAADARRNLADYQRQKAELDQFNKENPITPDALKKALGDLFAGGIPKEITDHLAGPVKDRVEKLEAEAVANYRAQKLAELEGKVMPELIKGNTKEEIDASIPFATEMFNKYAAISSAQAGVSNTGQSGDTTTPITPATPGAAASTPATPVTPPVVNTHSATPPPVKVPQVGTFTNPDEVALPDFKTMTPEQFASNRDAYVEQMRAFERQMGAKGK